MLARIFIMSVCCWWSAVSMGDDCPTDSLEFSESGDKWCYTIDSKNVCIKELNGFEPVTPANDYFYCSGSWQSQIPDQHGQHPPTAEQVPSTTTQSGTEGTVSPGGGNTAEGEITIEQ